MAARRYHELIAWQLANGFKNQVAAIVTGSAAANGDFRYRSQLLEASRAVSKDIAEGFLRFSPGHFVSFLDYALGSLAEAELRLIDGIELKYFTAPDCAEALRFAKRCTLATIRLKHSQVKYARQQALRKARMKEKRW